MGNRTKWAWALALAVTLTVAAFTPKLSEASTAREYALKAGYLFKFLHLVEWPNEGQRPNFVIAVVGPGPFGPSLDDLSGKVVRGKTIRLSTFDKVPNPAPTEQVILFVDRANQEKFAPIRQRLEKMNVLTVGEGAKFAEEGGCINLVTVKNRVRFRMNVDAVRRANLKVSPKLVEVASVLVTDKGEQASMEEYQDILAFNL
ncbi:MAG: YfiR family protein [Vulcanimicrobiota bacterium]